jgi:hypothetical protein
MTEESKEQDPNTVIEKTPIIGRSDKYVSLYSNQVEIGFSAWDVQFSFIQVHGRVSDVRGEEIASVTMSPQHAKALVLPLMRSVMKFEEQHGIVRIPGQAEHVSLWDMLKDAVQRSVKEAAAKKSTADGSAGVSKKKKGK